MNARLTPASEALTYDESDAAHVYLNRGDQRIAELCGRRSVAIDNARHLVGVVASADRMLAALQLIRRMNDAGHPGIGTLVTRTLANAPERRAKDRRNHPSPVSMAFTDRFFDRRGREFRSNRRISNP